MPKTKKKKGKYIKVLVSSLHWDSGEIFRVNGEDELYYYFSSDGCQCAVLKETEAEVIEDEK